MNIETKVTTNEWRQLAKVIYPKNNVYLVHVIAVICLFFSYNYYRMGSKMFVYYILIAIALEAMSIYFRQRNLNAHMKFFTDHYSDKELILIYQFYDKTFEVTNLITNDKTVQEYAQLAEVIDGPEHIILAAYGNHFYIFGRAEAEEKNLVPFLLEKNPAIKHGKRKIR